MDDLGTYLADCEPRYSPQQCMLRVLWNGPGYHTRIPNGTWAHPTREALDYALALLASGSAEHTTRAHAIIGAVLALQNTDSTSRFYGIWPWLLEEPLGAMDSADWNWADFCGARLMQMLAEYAHLLPGELAEAVRVALGHAAWSIFRRNVGPGYTNIAIMGAGVALVAGELLGEPRLVAYGRRRLQLLVEHTQQHGSFNEYNSPTYTPLALEECERILQLAHDAEGRAAAEWLRVFAWQTIAERFHPATGQWAGPHSRSYGDRLAAGSAAWLSDQTGTAIMPHPAADEARRGATRLVHHLPCPPALAERFARLPQSPLELHTRFIRRDDDARSTWGYTWMDDEACLGSVNCDSFWTQRRVVLGYWRTPEDPAVLLRLRFLHDGQDFASAALRSVQRGPRLLAAVGLFSNRGSWHLHLDRPANGLFVASDLRLRCELVGSAVTASTLGEQSVELRAGMRRAVLHMLPGQFGPYAVRWQLSVEEGRVFLDGICYTGEPRSFDLVALGAVAVPLGLELLTLEEQPAGPPICETRHADQVQLAWAEHDLALVAPLNAVAHE